ncbi:hypothetical protein DFJ73DRAFT_800742 [Zopfochytrium polystomum]|nr:hypothetical protein DFJ73DRAFT_800742 [Zopfochytrium polystomum]
MTKKEPLRVSPKAADSATGKLAIASSNVSKLNPLPQPPAAPPAAVVSHRGRLDSDKLVCGSVPVPADTMSNCVQLQPTVGVVAAIVDCRPHHNCVIKMQQQGVAVGTGPPAVSSRSASDSPPHLRRHYASGPPSLLVAITVLCGCPVPVKLRQVYPPPRPQYILRHGRSTPLQPFPPTLPAGRHTVAPRASTAHLLHLDRAVPDLNSITALSQTQATAKSADTVAALLPIHSRPGPTSRIRRRASNQSGGSGTTTTLPPIAAAATRQQPAASAPGAHCNRVYKAGGPSTFFTMDLVVPDLLELPPASAGAAGSGVLLCVGGGGGIGLGGVIRIGRGGVAPIAIAGAGLALSSQAAAAAVAAGARSAALASQAGADLAAVIKAAMGLLAAEAAAAAISGGSDETSGGAPQMTAEELAAVLFGLAAPSAATTPTAPAATRRRKSSSRGCWRFSGVGVDVIERAFGDAAARVSAAEGVLQQYWELELPARKASAWSTGTPAQRPLPQQRHLHRSSSSFADEDEEIAIIPGGATAAVVAKLSSSHLRVAVLGKDEALLLLYIDDEGDFVHLESDTDVRLMGASEESLDDNRALASGGAVSLSLTLVAVQSRTDSNTGRTGRGKGEPSKFGSLLAPVVIASLKMPVEAANLAEYVMDLESQLAQLREIVLGTPAQSPPPQQQQQQAVPAPGARAAEPDAKITKMSENNSNNNDDDGVPAAPDAGAAAHEGSTAEGVAAVVADHQALAGAAGEAVMTPDTRPSRRQHHRLFAATAAAIDHTENQPGRHRLARILVIIVIAVRVPGQLSHTCTLAPSNKGAHT